jgi:hypothetical protein
MRNLAVPFAHTPEGDLVLPQDAVVRSKTPYFCPECESIVAVRSPRNARRHYAHRPDAACALADTASTESYNHARAKHLAAAWLRGCIAGDVDLKVMRTCSSCAKKRSGNLDKILRKLGACTVETERTLRTGEELRRPDVCVIDLEKRPVLAVEILHSHRTRSTLAYKWIEVSAADILEHQHVFTPHAEGNLEPLQCSCVHEQKPVIQPVASPSVPDLSRFGFDRHKHDDFEDPDESSDTIAAEASRYARAAQLAVARYRVGPRKDDFTYIIERCPLNKGRPASVFHECAKCAYFLGASASSEQNPDVVRCGYTSKLKRYFLPTMKEDIYDQMKRLSSRAHAGNRAVPTPEDIDAWRVVAEELGLPSPQSSSSTAAHHAARTSTRRRW